MEQFIGFPLEQLISKYGGLTTESFTMKFKSPAIVIELDEKSTLPKAFDTHGGTVLSTGGSSPAAPGMGSQFAQFVQKTSRNAMKDKITVGRSNNNDVLVLHSSVSKFHAYFACEGDQWSVIDMGSTNGTFVDGAQVFEGNRVPMKNGQVLRLGGVASYFFSAKGLFDYMHIYRRMKNL